MRLVGDASQVPAVLPTLAQMRGEVGTALKRWAAQLGAEATGLCLSLEPPGGLVVAAGFGSFAAVGARLPLATPVLGRAARTGTPVWARWPGSGAAAGPAWRFVCAVPLVAGAQTLGVVAACHAAPVVAIERDLVVLYRGAVRLAAALAAGGDLVGDWTQQVLGPAPHASPP